MDRDLRSRFQGKALALAIAAALILGSARIQAQQERAGTPPAGNPANGKTIYNKYGCYQCHGYGGQGGPAGTRLVSNPISLSAFVRALRQPRNQMPPYTAKVVSDKEVADIYSFLQSLPKPPEAKNIPLLNE